MNSPAVKLPEHGFAIIRVFIPKMRNGKLVNNFGPEPTVLVWHKFGFWRNVATGDEHTTAQVEEWVNAAFRFGKRYVEYLPTPNAEMDVLQRVINRLERIKQIGETPVGKLTPAERAVWEERPELSSALAMKGEAIRAITDWLRDLKEESQARANEEQKW